MSKDITRQRSRLYLPLGFSFLLPLHQFFRLKQGQISIDRLRYKMSRPNVQKILYKNVQLVCLS